MHAQGNLALRVERPHAGPGTPTFQARSLPSGASALAAQQRLPASHAPTNTSNRMHVLPARQVEGQRAVLPGLAAQLVSAAPCHPGPRRHESTLHHFCPCQAPHATPRPLPCLFSTHHGRRHFVVKGGGPGGHRPLGSARNCSGADAAIFRGQSRGPPRAHELRVGHCSAEERRSEGEGTAFCVRLSPGVPSRARGCMGAWKFRATPAAASDPAPLPFPAFYPDRRIAYTRLVSSAPLFPFSARAEWSWRRRRGQTRPVERLRT